jgi:8-oxo-dGTP pyrophosphatase MutT (NUDIX family)
MTREPESPAAWANFLARLWGRRFPVDVGQIALEYSRRFDDPIHRIAPADISTFEGALYFLPKRKGWAILYNPSISSSGRINFTIAHELGHYLVHRRRQAAGFECGAQRVLGYDPDKARQEIEREADRFASYLLMPLDDYREQVRGAEMTLDVLRLCADRYGVSLTAAALKWIEHTEECAVVVVATNGFVLWCQRSDAARKKRIYFPKGMPLPAESAAARPTDASAAPSRGLSIPGKVWSPLWPCREMAILADRYEMTISLLCFDGAEFLPWDADDAEALAR